MPVPIQHVLGDDAFQLDPAPTRQRLQEQMHLRIMAQRLKVSHALHAIRDGLPIKDPSFIQFQIHIEAFLHQAFEDLRLDLAHELQLDASVPFIPAQMQLGIFFSQKLQLRQQNHGIHPVLQQKPVAHHRLQNRFRSGRFRAQTLPGPAVLQAQNRTDISRFGLLERFKFKPRVAPYLGDFFFAERVCPVRVRNKTTYFKLPARYLHQSHPVSLGVMLNLIDPRGESPAVFSCGGITIHDVQQQLHALKLQA